MSKESFNWKSLFINDSDNSSSKEESKSKPIEKASPSTVQTNKFPEEKIINTTNENFANPFVNEILEVYEKGFESLNLNDFDFFEMYKSVAIVGITNPQSYQMAFTMGKSIKPDLSKEYLLEKSKFYIDEINKVFAKYDSTGNIKKKDLNNLVLKEKETLTNTITDLENKILQMQQELQEKKTLLANIDSKNESELREIQLKIEANNFAKQKILDSINLVISGINQYL
ncbi:hypothetical protein SY27_10725 [Flavobacterium sp. 316]|uniref:OmpH family outer membrane protein n=1 Tax=Flavobacterium sediminilitoris TaxID=2024526 RepID=A0ABY4HQ66_9FLAO|nr:MULTISPECIES: OmpH family outer membrane protein [Flavobacterium]KIX21220.1 hypothetical protein SY27_10725 [Flavobacterium sp. 316]UOX35022.1 OmpH family outer membrane protein [Flavobacterium sediminilitoris]